VQGELPTSETTPTILTAKVNQVRNGNREIENEGESRWYSQSAFVKSESKNKQSNFYVQLAGGFNQNNDC
jgi:translocation and assembly module TamB